MSATVSPLIDAAALAARLHEPQLRVFDATVVLPPARFDGDYRPASGAPGWRQAHVPGSQHADLLHALSDPGAGFGFAMPAPQALAAALERLGIDSARPPVLYDRADGFWAARLWWMLRSLGVAAQVLDGGWAAWQAAGLPQARGDAAAPPAGRIVLRPRPEAWIDRAGVAAIVAGQRPGSLVCALPEAAFAGRVPTRYRRRGHLPGSHSLPARRLLDADGRYLPPAALAEAVGPWLATAPRPLVLYCGGGIAAAADALALTLLGETELALYDGSLQDWAADPALPLTFPDAG